MPGDPKECRERAAHCLEIAAATANDSIKQTLLTIARHWQLLAEELERAKSILDDEKGALKVSHKKRRGNRSTAGKSKRKRKKPAGTLYTKRMNAKRINGDARWSHW